MGRGAEARAVCERELKAAESCKLGGLDGLASQSVLWLHSLGRVLYDMCNLSEAAEKLEEALQRPGTPAATKVRPEHAVSLPATAHKPPIDETFLPNEPVSKTFADPQLPSFDRQLFCSPSSQQSAPLHHVLSLTEITLASLPPLGPFYCHSTPAPL